MKKWALITSKDISGLFSSKELAIDTAKQRLGHGSSERFIVVEIGSIVSKKTVVEYVVDECGLEE